MKLPPFSKPLHEFLLMRKKPLNDVYCFCGLNAWRKANYFSQLRFTMCLPPYVDPKVYKWPVRGCDILLFDGGNLDTIYIEETVFHLLCAGARIVRVISSDDRLFIYRQKELAA